MGRTSVGLTGASKDLYYASSRAVTLVQNGFLHNYLEKKEIGEELFYPANWDDKETYAWVEKEAKKIIARCYRETLEVLRKNKEFLFRIQRRLIKEKMLTEKNLIEMLSKNNILDMEKVYAS